MICYVVLCYASLRVARCPVLNWTVRFWGDLPGWKFQLELRTQIYSYRYIHMYTDPDLIFGFRTEFGNRSRMSGFSTCRPGNPIPYIRGSACCPRFIFRLGDAPDLRQAGNVFASVCLSVSRIIRKVFGEFWWIFWEDGMCDYQQTFVLIRIMMRIQEFLKLIFTTAR